MDDLRAQLHEKSGFQAGFSGILNWISNTAFGNVDQGAWNFGWLYNNLLRLTNNKHRGSQYSDDWEQYLEGEDPFKLSQLMALMLCSRRSLAYIIRRYPPILEMDVTDIGSRMVALKLLLPSCDVALLVELQPRLFMGANRGWVEGQVGAASRQLRSELRGADVDSMIEEDPLLLFTEISSGIRRLKELWDVDEQALGNSSAAHLALAVRALSDSGPPRRF